MGALKKTNLATSALEREERAPERKKTVEKLVSKPTLKTKNISGKVRPDTWEQFCQICDSQGMSKNSVLNALITRFVRDNQEYLN